MFWQRDIVLYFIMLFLWILFNGRFTWEVFIIGLLVCAAIDYFNLKTLGYDIKKSVLLSKYAILFIKYQIILVIEIIKSSFHTMSLILFHSNEIKPKTIKFHSNLLEDRSKIMLANSITLTPGTITAALNDGEFIVHVLDGQAAHDLEHSIFVKQLTQMEGKINGSL